MSCYQVFFIPKWLIVDLIVSAVVCNAYIIFRSDDVFFRIVDLIIFTAAQLLLFYCCCCW